VNGIFTYYFLHLHYYLKAERVSVPNGGAPPEPLAVSYFYIISAAKRRAFADCVDL